MTLTPQAGNSYEEGEEEFNFWLANDKLYFLLVADGCISLSLHAHMHDTHTS
jgi:hypothetical protein